MREGIEDVKYDVKLEPSDWRYAAAILGLLKYFKFHHMEDSFKMQEECILYQSHAITENNYLEYVEHNYADEFHHKIVEQQLRGDEFTEEQIKFVNEHLIGNTIMKKIFGKLKFDGTNKEEIQQLIEGNRKELVRETYRYKNNLYKNFCNTNLLFQEGQSCCRLWGYYIDLPKKGKSVSYGFDTTAFHGQDIQEFDFIPFAFTGDREDFFINDSISLKNLWKTNTSLETAAKKAAEKKNSNQLDTRRTFFKLLIESADFIDYDVEVIVKKRDASYFETMFIRKKSIEIFKTLDSKTDLYQSFCFSYKVNENYYINILKEVTESILNLVLLDQLIELFLKADAKDGNFSYITKILIDLNLKIRGGGAMDRTMKGAYACAKKVAEIIPENKLISYRQKLTSAIVFKDYERVELILLQLSNYADVQFDFVYDLYENFEENKELAFTFINSLRKSNKNKEQGGTVE